MAHHQSVDHDGDVVLVTLVEHDRLLQHAHAIVDLHAREAVVAELALEEAADCRFGLYKKERGHDNEARCSEPAPPDVLPR